MRIFTIGFYCLNFELLCIQRNYFLKFDLFHNLTGNVGSLWGELTERSGVDEVYSGRLAKDGSEHVWGVTVVWWSVHRIAAREVRGSNLGAAENFSWRNRSRLDRMDGWMRAQPTDKINYAGVITGDRTNTCGIRNTWGAPFCIEFCIRQWTFLTGELAFLRDGADRLWKSRWHHPNPNNVIQWSSN